MPSGAILKIGLAPFRDGRELYQAVLKEAKDIDIDSSQEIDSNFFKNIACYLFSSKDIEEKLEKCFEKCLYNGQRIGEETFELEEARQDYFEVMILVAKENILPFGKALLSEYGHLFDQVKEGLK